MNELYERSERRINNVSTDFNRGLMDSINWNARLIGIRGARGVGKTTLLLQHLNSIRKDPDEVLYASLDNLWFASHSLLDLADDFEKKGGRYLCLDEVHKYPDWSIVLKNLYDDFPKLKIVFTGSSLLEILNARADLSRRAVVYSMQGLSFREYLNMTLDHNFPIVSLHDLLKGHVEIAREINKVIRPLKHFPVYLKQGYYPFFTEGADLYFQRIGEVANMILEIELPLLRKVEIQYVSKIKQLLQVISETAPFIPNVSKLSEKIGINRNTLSTYLFFLREAHLTRNLYRDSKGISRLQKPDKIFLENTNFMYAFAPEEVNTGSLRETYFMNQLEYAHRVEYTAEGDFLVDGRYVFEIGGRSKNDRQIRGIPHAYVAADHLESGHSNVIPLWMFGLLY
ncbi:MAG: AAA family ATPase [Bacteroidetes bacterium GWF2_43_63]|nr:MAG: AAA family ATPase [Bacteroidetes bacterium GWE2_42_42]OFY56054.1 MAG: AAA family ATPase [Bacteroidetes bacterium GWF2_43_63]HBG70696.1 AAA family ATPase [Bacteroidales bacterium]HCB62476.1 AAA family ATPase [Bacteroidales bacterium]HCY21931.1 AAA family ATPase [Bacteroidales bacterium]